MKKNFLFLIILLFSLSGCSQSQSNVNNSYEIIKGTSTLSYYDAEENIDIEGFTILERTFDNVMGMRSQGENSIIVSDGTIRCIYIVDEDIITYKEISVGDKIDKIKETFNNEFQGDDYYMVLFNGNIEEDSSNQNKDDSWIWILYYTDGSQITSIEICDVLFGTMLK